MIKQLISSILLAYEDILVFIYNYYHTFFLGFTLSLLFLYILFFLHLILWSWRELEISAHSFLSLIFLVITPFLYFLGFARGLEGSLKLEEFSQISFYRYVFYVVFFLGLLLSYLGRSFGYFPWIGGESNLPNPRKEFSSFLLSFNSFFLNFFSLLVELLYEKKGGRKIFYELLYISLHIIFSRLIPLTQVFLFLLGVFLWKDIQYSLLFLPFSFLSWFYGLMNHALLSFVEKNLWGIQEVLDISPPPEDMGKEWMGGPRGMSFQLTERGKMEGYGPGNIPAMAEVFYSICNQRNLERRLNPPWLLHFPLFLLSLRIIAWMVLCYHLFPEDYHLMEMNIPLWSLWRNGSQIGGNLPLRGGKAPRGRELLDRKTFPQDNSLELKRISLDKEMSLALAKTSLAGDNKHDLVVWMQKKTPRERKEASSLYFLVSWVVSLVCKVLRGINPKFFILYPRRILFS